MVELIYYVGVFYLLHLFLRMSFSLNKVPYVEWSFAGGDVSNENNLSKRMVLASENLRQTLPIFLTFAVLSVVLKVDNLLLAQIWLGLRVAYLLGAMIDLYKFKHVRPFIWAPSIIVLFMMGSNLIA